MTNHRGRHAEPPPPQTTAHIREVAYVSLDAGVTYWAAPPLDPATPVSRISWFVPGADGYRALAWTDYEDPRLFVPWVGFRDIGYYCRSAVEEACRFLAAP